MSKKMTMNNTTTTTSSSSSTSKSTKFFILGLIGHAYLIFFITSYAYILTTSTHSHTHHSSTSSPTHKEHNPHLFSSLSSDNDISMDFFMINSDPKWLVNCFAIISGAILYVSLYFRFTWPIRIEETVIIVLLWILISNTFNDSCHCCSKSEGGGGGEEYNKSFTSPPPSDHHHHSIMSQNDTNISISSITNTTSDQDDIKKRNNDGGGGELTKEDYYHGKEEEETDTFLCHSQISSIVFSILCISTAIFSFLSDIKNHTVSLLFRGFSFISMTIIIFLPVSCNQFRFADINILILKVTLYDIVWNLNRYMRYTEIQLENEYRKCVDYLSKYDIVLVKKKTKKKKKKRSNIHEEEDYNIGEEDDEEEEEEEEEEKEEKIITTKELKMLSISPYILFTTIREIGDRLKQDNISLKSKKLLPKLTLPYKTDNDFNASNQVTLIQKICHISSRYYKNIWCTNLLSWKYRYYDDSINYLIDIARTIPILAICHFYLFYVIFIVLWLLYYIRVNSNELNNVLVISKVMGIIHKNKVPVYTI